MSGTVEMAINQLVFFLLALGQTLFMSIDPALVVVESGSKFSYSRSYILLRLFTVDQIYYVTRVAV